jgi:hypothetical protein
VGRLVGRLLIERTSPELDRARMIARGGLELRQLDEGLQVQPAQLLSPRGGPIFVAVGREQVPPIEIKRLPIEPRLSALTRVRDRRLEGLDVIPDGPGRAEQEPLALTLEDLPPLSRRGFQDPARHMERLMEVVRRGFGQEIRPERFEQLVLEQPVARRQGAQLDHRLGFPQAPRGFGNCLPTDLDFKATQEPQPEFGRRFARRCPHRPIPQTHGKSLAEPATLLHRLRPRERRPPAR